MNDHWNELDPVEQYKYNKDYHKDESNLCYWVWLNRDELTIIYYSKAEGWKKRIGVYSELIILDY